MNHQTHRLIRSHAQNYWMAVGAQMLGAGVILVTAELTYAMQPHAQAAGDGADTCIQAGSVNNLGTGRIYGDRVVIAAGTLTNQEETLSGVTTAATIAGRERVDIGAQTLTNRENALIYSGGG